MQIAAASLWLKARRAAPDAQPRALHLVASNLRLSGLQQDDAELKQLRQQVEQEAGIPGALVDQVLGALRGADHLGSLLQVDRAVDEALAQQPSEGVAAGRAEGAGGAVDGQLAPAYPFEIVDQAHIEGAAQKLGRLGQRLIGALALTPAELEKITGKRLDEDRLKELLERVERVGARPSPGAEAPSEAAVKPKARASISARVRNMIEVSN